MGNSNFVKTEVDKLRQCPDLYFERGLEAFEALKAISDKDLRIVQDYFKKHKKGVCDSFRKEHPGISEKFERFIAYCDVQAQGTNPGGQSYYIAENGKIDKRCIAKALIYQNAWVTNLVQYLLNLRDDKLKDDGKYNDVSYGVKRALKYFETRGKLFPILSKSHIELISKAYLDGCPEDEFDKVFLEYCKNNLPDDLSKVNEANLTYCYSVIIYGKRCDWDKVDTTFYTQNHNVILTGAPGTGKTYLAKKVAAAIIGCDFDKLEESPYYKFVQFHPSYDYTDFVEGLRPCITGDSVGFKYCPGTFRSFCENALNDDSNGQNKDDQKYVIVIDEINRGEISKIFGELFFSIDPGYRGHEGSVTTQYANVATKSVFPNNRFYVPKNVYIIGTMNDIDRSVESMDFAFRRRFAFLEITAKESQDAILMGNPAMQDNNIDLGNVVRVMDAVNDKLEDLGLNESYHIGAAYFTKLSKYSNQRVSMWDSLWKYHLKGVIYEYFRGEPDADKKLKEVYDAYTKAISK